MPYQDEQTQRAAPALRLHQRSSGELPWSSSSKSRSGARQLERPVTIERQAGHGRAAQYLCTPARQEPKTAATGDASKSRPGLDRAPRRRGAKKEHR
jgi:hypothetical protein